MIYDGKGASNLCIQAWEREIKEIVDTRFHKIEKFNSSYTAGFERGNIASIIIPGGDAHAMCRVAELAGNINNAVRNQASFLGSCAGAILSSSFYCDENNKVCNSGSRFNINPVPYRSKYYMPKSEFANNPENISALEVEWLPSCGHFQSNICRLYYAFGPSFPLESLPSNCRVLAQFKTDGNVRKAVNSAATVLYKPLQNNAASCLITSIHPEISVSDICSEEFALIFGRAHHPHIENLVNQLKDSEIVRKEMCRSWFSELGLNVKI
jgi:glutamine amidotransferase PdxT